MHEDATLAEQKHSNNIFHRPSGFSGFVLSCFFMSGVAGLIYQVLWVRMIDKVIGSAPFAVATVLSVFMGGLALGSYLAGRYIDRITSRGTLLSLYGKVEIAIGIYGLILPFFIIAVEPVYRLTYNYLFEHFWLYQFFAFIGCSLLLLIPTALMGVTLPVLCRFYVFHLDHLGTRTGRLYGLNTVGAAVGALLCGFLLIRSLGVWGTLFVAAGINFLVGLICILLAKRKREAFSEETVERDETNIPLDKIHSEMDRGTNGNKKYMVWALFIFAVSGFCSMGYEVFWARLLGLIIGPTTYSFTIVISTFIIGLAGGSLFFGWLGDRSRRVFTLLAITQLCAAFLALVVSQFLGNSQFFFSKLIYTFQDDFSGMILGQSIILFLILLGPTFFLGATFPLVNRIYARSIPVIGRSIGTAYALNTVGAILGSFVAGFFLIPLMGKESGLRLLIALQFVVALAALMPFALQTRNRNRQWLVGIVTTLAGLVLILNFPSWNRKILSRGWYRTFEVIEPTLKKTSWFEAVWHGSALLERQQKDFEVVFYGDGIGGFTTVEKETTSVGTVEYGMLNSGKPDASSHGDRITQTLLAHIPMLFHPNPEEVMVLGLASGMTAGETLLYPVKRLDVLEINEQVVDACKLFFTPWNNACLSDPRTRLVVQDGRNHLALTREKYDVIISEPSNPWMAGLANLYTLEFFYLVKDRLKEQGIFAQWLHTYEMDWDTFALVGRTFQEVFPEGLLMKMSDKDYLFVGILKETGLDWKTAKKNAKYARDSSNVSLRNPGFLVHLIVTEDLSKLFATGPIHTDNWPHLEFAAPQQLYGRDVETISKDLWLSPQTQEIIQANSNVDTILDLVEFAASAYTPLFDMINFEDMTPPQKDRYDKIVTRFCGEMSVSTYEIFPEMESIEKCAQIQIRKIRRKLNLEDSRACDHYNLSLDLIAIGQIEQAITELRITVSLDPLHFDAHANLGSLLASKGKLQEAATYLYQAIEIDPQEVKIYKMLGSIHLQLGKTEQAVKSLSQAAKIDPNDVDTLNNLGVAFYEQGQFEEAMKHFSEALRVAPNNQDVINNVELVSKKIRKPLEVSKEP